MNTSNWGEGIPSPENLPEAIAQLFELLEERNSDYLLVGGIALLSYVAARNTQDIDFILSRQDLEVMPEIVVSSSDRDFARGDFQGLQVDLLLTDNALFEEVRINYASDRALGSRTIRIVTVEGLILLKLYALPSLYRQGRFDRAALYEGDIRILLLSYSVETEPLIQELAKHLLVSDAQKVRSILEDIQEQVRRRDRF